MCMFYFAAPHIIVSKPSSYSMVAGYACETGINSVYFNIVGRYCLNSLVRASLLGASQQQKAPPSSLVQVLFIIISLGVSPLSRAVKPATISFVQMICASFGHLCTAMNFILFTNFSKFCKFHFQYMINEPCVDNSQLSIYHLHVCS